MTNAQKIMRNFVDLPQRFAAHLRKRSARKPHPAFIANARGGGPALPGRDPVSPIALPGGDGDLQEAARGQPRALGAERPLSMEAIELMYIKNTKVRQFLKYPNIQEDFTSS